MTESRSNRIAPNQNVVLERSVATVVLFSVFTICVYMLLVRILPFGALANLLTSVVFAWLLLRLPVPSLCAVILASIGWTWSQPSADNLSRSLMITYLGCGMMLFRITYNSLRDRLVIWWVESQSPDGAKVEVGETDARDSVPASIDSELMMWSGWIFFAVGIVLMSVVALTYFPLGNRMPKWTSWAIQNRQVFWPGPTSLVLVALVAIVIREWMWRDLTPSQAAMFLRSETLRLHFGDLARITRYRSKQRGMTKKKGESEE